MAEVETIRRVITAQMKDGKNVVSIDERVEPIISGGLNTDRGQQLWQIWGSDSIPQLPTDATEAYADTLFAPPGGFRIQICEFPAASGSTLEPRGTWPPLGTLLARGDTGAVGDKLDEDMNDRIMHYTNSVDIMVVLEGELGFVIDGGPEVTLRAGDVLVNNGISHAWKNGPVPCRICMIAQGAERPTG
jgi:mannose-6-phosphate isomerase-like protein (cupin superfamily)